MRATSRTHAARSGGNPALRIMPISRAVLHQVGGVARPVEQRARRGDGGDAAHERVVGRLAHRERAAVPEPGEPHAAHVVALVEHAHRGAQVVEPADRGEVALRRARAAEVEREHEPPGLVREAVGELGIGVADRRRAAWPVREAVAQHEPERASRRAAATRSARTVGGHPTGCCRPCET